MLTKTLAAAAALSMLVGGSALAAQPKSTVSASPKQPIPYSELNAYLKATPKTRASKDWWSGSSSASTGMSTDTSATAPMASTTTPSTSMSAMPPATTTTPDTSVNPPNSAAPPSMPSTPPTNAPAQPDTSSTTPMPK